MSDSLLSAIRSPADVQCLSSEQLGALAAEIRTKLIETVSQTGGHLASNLGVVELTIALHRCFDSPKDKLIWDVGHQVYTHKLLTGRQADFSSLRQEGGLSGFSRPNESEHDIFYAGHAGTSVSGALGLASANAIQGDGSCTVAVVGDGAFTGGMIYEALNHAGRTQNNLIVVLNENEMSISENVGALARYLTALRTRPEYYRLKARTERLLEAIPLVGRDLRSGVYKMKSTMKNMMYQSTWFEEMGFRYIGPLDGHDTEQLCAAFRSAKLMRRPVLIHINTVKGKGYDFAEKAPAQFHGISRFDIVSGEPLPSGETYSECFGKKMCALAQQNMNVCAVTAAMALGTGLSDFSQRFEGRFFDVGIAEEHAVTFTLGLARGGMIPVFAVYSTFLQRCFDQLLHDGTLQEQKMIIAVDRAGFVGGDGETHQGLYDAALMNGIPKIQIDAPACFAELESMLERAVRGEKRVTAIRYPRGSETPLPKEFLPDGAPFTEFGDPDAALGLVCYGRIFAAAAQAYAALQEEGIPLKIIKLNRIKPIDPAAVEAAKSCRALAFFEEGVRSGGIGESFARRLLESGFAGCFRLTAVEDCFVEQAEAAALLQRHRLDASGMQEILRELHGETAAHG